MGTCESPVPVPPPSQCSEGHGARSCFSASEAEVLESSRAREKLDLFSDVACQQVIASLLVVTGARKAKAGHCPTGAAPQRWLPRPVSGCSDTK